MILGNIYRQGYADVNRARQHYEQALKHRSTYIPAIRAMVELYRSSEDWEEVVATYSRCLELFPEKDREQKIPLLLEKAEILSREMGKSEEVIPVYREILEIAPDHRVAHTVLADLYSKNKKNRGEALIEHHYLLTQEPFRIPSYHELFRLYLEEKQYDKAYVCAQALGALEQLLPEQKKFLTQIADRVASGWLDPWKLDNFVQEKLRGTLYEIMAAIDSFTEKIYCPDLEADYGVKRKDRIVPDGQQAICRIVNQVVRLLSIDDLALYVNEGTTIALENTQPASLILGNDLLGLPPAQLYFIISRALFYVSRHQVMAFKLNAEQYAHYVARLVEAFAETGKQPSAENETISKKLRNALPRRIRNQLEERMDILTEIYHTDTLSFLTGIELAANNCGLLLSDSLQDSCRAYCEIIKRQAVPARNFENYNQIKELFWFNISDEHCRLRNELGLTVKWIV